MLSFSIIQIEIHCVIDRLLAVLSKLSHLDLKDNIEDESYVSTSIGGYSDIYCAWSKRHEKRVAVKKFRFHLLTERSFEKVRCCANELCLRPSELLWPSFRRPNRTLHEASLFGSHSNMRMCCRCLDSIAPKDSDMRCRT